MDAIKHALQEQLEETIERLKGLGGAVVFEDYPGAPEDDGQGDAGSDGASIGGERELAFEVRGRLVERANRLAEALDRLRFGEYGTCQICGVTTCVACQDAEERRARVSTERVGAR